MRTDHVDDDDILPVLARGQAEQFHRLIVRSLQQRHLPSRWNGNDSYDVDGATMGISNLAAIVAAAPAADWPEMVDHHIGVFADLKAQRPAGPQLHMLYPRIRRRRGERTCHYALEPAAGIEVVLAVDYPHYLTELESLDDVASLGAPEELWATALANLRTLPDPRYELVELDADSLPVELHAFQFEDYFGPSRLLLGHELLRRYLPRARHGYFIMIPDRHTLAVTPVTKEVVPQCNRLATIAQSLYESSPGATSPAVYHLGDADIIEEVAYITAENSAYIRLNEVMGAAMTGSAG